MPTSRSYGDACAIARALDVVGERWALLVVRELLLGPQRFSDLRRALPGASSNMLTDRLRELQARGVLVKRQLYELTESGRELEPIILALGGWGLRYAPPEPAHLSAASVLLFLRGSRTPQAPGVYRVELGDRAWTVTAADGRLHIEPGEPADPAATLRTDPATLNALLGGETSLAAARASGAASVSGDEGALDRLLSG
ncbi:winged helix-turn-helix transcriptional regulator [Actinoplanes sp. NPDC048796]|uniref:winged helix-turn-helix transcriptional regulator n=1 Tax=unclassified Actinoplanes TaxID=2626549 RepID=UPI0033DF0721